MALHAVLSNPLGCRELPREKENSLNKPVAKAGLTHSFSHSNPILSAASPISLSHTVAMTLVGTFSPLPTVGSPLSMDTSPLRARSPLSLSQTDSPPSHSVDISPNNTPSPLSLSPVGTPLLSQRDASPLRAAPLTLAEAASLSHSVVMTLIENPLPLSSPSPAALPLSQNPSILSRQLSAAPPRLSLPIATEESEANETSLYDPDEQCKIVSSLILEDSQNYFSRPFTPQSLRSITVCLIELASHLGKKRMHFVPLGKGINNTRIIVLDGSNSFILKDVVPKSLIQTRSALLNERISRKEGTLKERLKNIFIDNPGQIYSHEFSRTSFAHREMVASIIGRVSGMEVPETHIIRTKSGLGIIQRYVENIGTLKECVDLICKPNVKLNLQSVQNFALLTILTEDQDCHWENAVVTMKRTLQKKKEDSAKTTITAQNKDEFDPNIHELVLTSIDHSLCFQKKDFLPGLNNEGMTPPCWLKLKEADAPLTPESLGLIQKLNFEEIVSQFHRRGLRINVDGGKVVTSLKRNINFLKAEVASITKMDSPNRATTLTSRKLFEDFSRFQSLRAKAQLK